MVTRSLARPSKPLFDEYIAGLQSPLRKAHSAGRLWDEILTQDERLELGGDLEEIWRKRGTIGMWMQLRKVTQTEASVELGYELGLLDPPTYTWMIQEIGKKPQMSKQPELPEWDSSTGELRLKGRTIRRVRIWGKRSNVQIILDAFERQQWKVEIDNPFKLDQQMLHQALRSLNKNLTDIRFHSSGGAQRIFWNATNSQSTPSGFR